MVLEARKPHAMKSSFNVDSMDVKKKSKTLAGRASHKAPLWWALAAVFVVSAVWWSSSRDTDGLSATISTTKSGPMVLTCSGFENGGTIPMKYARNGDNLSPPLSWSNVPAGTKSFVLIVDDPDAPSATPWVHWVVANIPSTMTSLSEGQKIDPPAQEASNSWSLSRYDGPQPPKGQNHLYVFTLYALNDTLSLQATATKEVLSNSMTGHILEEAKWTGRFGS